MPPDIDGDGTCDALDDDIDGDGIPNDEEIDLGDNSTNTNNPTLTVTEYVMVQQHQMPAFVLQVLTISLLDSSETIDTDGDGTGDNADTDDDDGWSDVDEALCGTNSMSGASIPLDGDADGICDKLDDKILGYSNNGVETDVFEAVINQPDFIILPNLTGMESVHGRLFLHFQQDWSSAEAWHVLVTLESYLVFQQRHHQ